MSFYTVQKIEAERFNLDLQFFSFGSTLSILKHFCRSFSTIICLYVFYENLEVISLTWQSDPSVSWDDTQLARLTDSNSHFSPSSNIFSKYWDFSWAGYWALFLLPPFFTIWKISVMSKMTFQNPVLSLLEYCSVINTAQS